VAAPSICRPPAPGFIYGLAIGDNFIRRGQFKRRVMVIGVEVLSRIVDWHGSLDLRAVRRWGGRGAAGPGG
jgi:hypothetical protein